jgi:hypothetical protein
MPLKGSIPSELSLVALRGISSLWNFRLNRMSLEAFFGLFKALCYQGNSHEGLPLIEDSRNFLES